MTRRQVGDARVLSRQVLNENLKKLELAEADERERERVALDRKLTAEAKKDAKEALEKQWRVDFEMLTAQETA